MGIIVQRRCYRETWIAGAAKRPHEARSDTDIAQYDAIWSAIAVTEKKISDLAESRWCKNNWKWCQ